MERAPLRQLSRPLSLLRPLLHQLQSLPPPRILSMIHPLWLMKMKTTSPAHPSSQRQRVSRKLAWRQPCRSATATVRLHLCDCDCICATATATEAGTAIPLHIRLLCSSHTAPPSCHVYLSSFVTLCMLSWSYAPVWCMPPCCVFQFIGVFRLESPRIHVFILRVSYRFASFPFLFLCAGKKKRRGRKK